MAIAVQNPENANDESQIPGPPSSPPIEMTITSGEGKPLPPPHITQAVLNLDVYVELEHFDAEVRANNMSFTIDLLRRLDGGELPYLRRLRLIFECADYLVEHYQEIFFDALAYRLLRTGGVDIKAEELKITIAGHCCGQECEQTESSDGILHMECSIAEDLVECIRIYQLPEEGTESQKRELVFRTK